MTKTLINQIIQRVYETSQLNFFKSLQLPLEPMWQPPITGYAAGNDPLFGFLRDDIGDFYWLPSEVYDKSNPSQELQSHDETLTVVSIGFSQTAATKKDQAGVREIPCDKWLVTRGEWEAFIKDFCRRLVVALSDEGIEAVAVDLLPSLQRENSIRYGFASNWSHRHTAFVAGLGTFGLSEGLITRQGKAMRFTSLVVKATLPADERKYRNHQEWCAFHANGTCGACMYRCPVNAITPAGHDKNRCSDYLNRLKKELGPSLLTQSHYISGCGLCQTKVPCQDGIPAGLAR
ncbi:hypothetical protein [Anoxynatronum buryatiense]|uniref:Epoxyqueuosine reductase n=1 Tax=Anoxynatronum buryatiense TaxID=489973 RepID=A0AA46AHC2_9CLOT|nr:hypothetical protein [Anoxynatronum buryatiense]SMP38629.1 hypothetical protein SAMN06296020_101128 [Anoxynatronum buryatiense]